MESIDRIRRNISLVNEQLNLVTSILEEFSYDLNDRTFNGSTMDDVIVLLEDCKFTLNNLEGVHPNDEV